MTITDAGMPAVSFTTAAVSVAEAAGSVTLTLQLSGAAPSALSFPGADGERSGQGLQRRPVRITRPCPPTRW